MTCKAKDLKRGDIFRLHVFGQVVAVEAVADGKRIKVALVLEHQGARRQCGVVTGSSGSALEFTDDGCFLKFICKPSRTFSIYDDYGGGDDGDDEPEDLPPDDDDGLERPLKEHAEELAD